MLKRISNSIYWWTEMHGEARGSPYTWNSYAIHCPDSGVLALVDPLPMTAEEIFELETIGKPTHILLSCEFHVRESAVYRDKWGCQILANRLEHDWYEIELDGHFEDGQNLWGRVDLVYVPDVKFQETAFLVRENGGILIVGDLLAGGRQDQGIPDEGLALCGPHCVADLKAAKQSLRKLLDLKFDTLCFAHGTPVRDEPLKKLKDYIESQAVWIQLEKDKVTTSQTQAQKEEFRRRWELSGI